MPEGSSGIDTGPPGRTAGSNGPLIISREVIAARTTAESILRDARIEADRIIFDAQTESTRITRDAFQEGLHRGISQFNQALNAALLFREELERTAEQELLELCMAVVNRLIDKNTEFYRAVLREMLCEAIAMLKTDRGVIVFLSELDSRLLSTAIDSMDPLILDPLLIQIRTAESLEKGECILESVRGSIRCSVRTRLQAIDSAVRDNIDNSHREGLDNDKSV